MNEAKERKMCETADGWMVDCVWMAGTKKRKEWKTK